MSDNILSQQKMPKLIVVVAFDRDAEGELQPVYGPAEQQSEERAVRTAKTLHSFGFYLETRAPLSSHPSQYH